MQRECVDMREQDKQGDSLKCCRSVASDATLGTDVMASEAGLHALRCFHTLAQVIAYCSWRCASPARACWRVLRA